MAAGLLSDLEVLVDVAEGVEALRGVECSLVEAVELLAGEEGAEDGVEDDLCASVVVAEAGELSLMMSSDGQCTVHCGW